MEVNFINCDNNGTPISFALEESKIYGITGADLTGIKDIISLNSIHKGQILINGIKVNKDNITNYHQKIKFIDRTINTSQTNIFNIMIDYIKRHNLKMKDPFKKIVDSLKIVELEEIMLSRSLATLSQSEKKLLQLSICLLSNPDIIVLEEPFKFLDKYHEKKIMMLFQRLKEQYKKTIVIISEDSNILYKYTTEMIFLKNNEILLCGNTNEVYLQVELLKKNKFSIPDIVLFTYLAKKKKEVKIDYHKDVRDIIKDIYKHI